MTLHLDDNLDQHPDGRVTCRHCATVVGDADQPLRSARVRESDPQQAGPSVREDPRLFTERPIVLRQTFCTGCLVLLQAEIVPADEPSSRHRSVQVQA